MTDQRTGLLGDTPHRSYGDKLERYDRFLEPELRSIIDDIGILPGNRVLDAGCGTGLVSRWLAEQVGQRGSVVGIDLAHKHIEIAAEKHLSRDLPLRFMQGDITQPIFGPATFDLIWTYNTINHLHDPVAGLRTLAGSLVQGGQLVLVQNLLLPEMIFAWDERLEHAVVGACRAYYRDKYGVTHREITGQRNIYGWMLGAGFEDVTIQTYVAERVPPLEEADLDYFQHSVFEGYWGEKLQPYLDAGDWEELVTLTDLDSDAYALRRPDFHAMQTCTVVTGHVT